MTESIIQFGLIAAAALAAGSFAGWVFRGAATRRELESLSDEWRLKYDEAVRQRDRFRVETETLRNSLEEQQAALRRQEIAVGRGQTELESTREKMKSLSKEMFAIGAERDSLKNIVSNSNSVLAKAKQQVASLEREFVKAGNFYKGELEKAFEKRKALEMKTDGAKADQESLSNLLDASRSETESVNKMLASAQSRLKSFDALEASVIRLEAENAGLRHDATRNKQEIDALERDVAELDELKVQNKELAHCLQSIENSRQQYEYDAKRYRNQAEQSTHLSDTLQMKLEDVEKNLADMAKKQEDAMHAARETGSAANPASKANGHAPPREIDDLTEIVGIGKAFQQMLHDLDVYSFREIAQFGPGDIARVNMELKEFKGRMEQDDWIGQAKELLFKKYGEAEAV